MTREPVLHAPADELWKTACPSCFKAHLRERLSMTDPDDSLNCGNEKSVTHAHHHVFVRDYPLLRRPAAMPLMVRWIARTTRSSVLPER